LASTRCGFQWSTGGRHRRASDKELKLRPRAEEEEEEEEEEDEEKEREKENRLTDGVRRAS